MHNSHTNQSQYTGSSQMFAKLVLLLQLLFHYHIIACDLIDDYQLIKQLADTSNDHLALANTQELITKAGFKYENYHTTSTDGYVLQLTRVINPLVERNNLRYLPVLVHHGQTLCSATFVQQSNNRHFPMQYPLVTNASSQLAAEQYATPQNKGRYVKMSSRELRLSHRVDNSSLGGRRSSQRALALALSNEGHDVWLLSSRGVDAKMRRRDRGKLTQIQINSYWSFSQDEQALKDLPAQIDKVLEITRRKKINYVGYSQSTTIMFALLSWRPEMANKIDTFVAISPIVFMDHIKGLLQPPFALVAPFTPRVNIPFLGPDFIADTLRLGILAFCNDPTIRYTICSAALNLFLGLSPFMQTNLELPIFGHLLQLSSLNSLLQLAQFAYKGKFSRYDYMNEKDNLLAYNMTQPPEYDLSRIRCSSIAIITGGNDFLSTPEDVSRLKKSLQFKPLLDLEIPDYNHLDLSAARDIDTKVNRPILDLLNQADQALRLERGNFRG